MNAAKKLSPAQQQFGNKNAVGNRGGAPRKTSFTPEEMIELGEEMIAWLMENRKSVFHLSEWYTIEKMFTYNEWKAFIQKPEFIPYYEQALKIVSRKYLNGDVAPAIAQRWQRIYFGDIREQEDLDAVADAQRKANALKSESRAAEEEKQQVIAEVLKSRRDIK